jgi:glutamine amidotransferase
VHSYFAEPAQSDIVAGYSLYPFPFTCAAGRGNLFAVQFHPEKSHEAGLKLLANFAAWQPQRENDTGDIPGSRGVTA